jgi:hypothetical protein
VGGGDESIARETRAGGQGWPPSPAQHQHKTADIFGMNYCGLI